MGVDESIVVLQPALLTLTAQAGFVEKIDVRSNTVYPSGICSNYYSSLKMAEFTETVQQDVYTIERRQANDDSNSILLETLFHKYETTRRKVEWLIHVYSSLFIC